MKVEKQPIHGSTRQRVITNDGIELQRQFLYFRPKTWVKLAKLASEQGTGGSQVVEHLITLAYEYSRKPKAE